MTVIRKYNDFTKNSEFKSKILKVTDKDEFVTHYPRVGLTDNVNIARTFDEDEVKGEIPKYEKLFNVKLEPADVDSYYEKFKA